MSKTVLADVDGFTPIIDSMAIEHGLIYAAVFGRMWRFCQFEDGVCKASLETIAHGLHVDRATVMRYAEKLVKDGYLKDLTPNLRNVPHTYADTGKASIKIGVVAQDNAEIRTVAHSNSSVAHSNRTVAQSNLKKVSKKVKEETIDSSTAFSTRDIQKAYESCVPYKVDWVKGEGHAAKWLAEAGYTPDEIKACYAELKAQDFWRTKSLSLTSLKKQVGEWKQHQRKVIEVH